MASMCYNISSVGGILQIYFRLFKLIFSSKYREIWFLILISITFMIRIDEYTRDKL